MFSYEAKNESANFRAEDQFKSDLILLMMDYVSRVVFNICMIVLLCFRFIFTQENLISTFRENSLLTKFQNFKEKMGDNDSFEMEMNFKSFFVFFFSAQKNGK